MVAPSTCDRSPSSMVSFRCWPHLFDDAHAGAVLSISVPCRIPFRKLFETWTMFSHPTLSSTVICRWFLCQIFAAPLAANVFFERFRSLLLMGCSCPNSVDSLVDAGPYVLFSAADVVGSSCVLCFLSSSQFSFDVAHSCDWCTFSIALCALPVEFRIGIW